MKHKLSFIVLYLWSLLMTSVIFAQTQTFVPTKIAQTIIQDAMTGQCTNHNRHAFYQWSSARFYSTLSAFDITTTLRIFNTQTGQNNLFYEKGAPDSTKIFIYNPYGALSTGLESNWPDSFLSDFGYMSNIKPGWVNSVYVGYQNNPTYMIGDPTKRNQTVWQIVHNIRRRTPSSVRAWWTTYTYIPFNSWTQHTINLSLFRSDKTWFNRTDLGEYRCHSIYIATCGDGIVDNTIKSGWNNTDGKQWIKTIYWFVPWTISTFTGEVCDSTTIDWTSCVNGTTGCCNLTCSWYGDGAWINERCWDETLQPAGSFYNWDENNMSFEECDDGDEEWDTDGVTNGDNPELYFCSAQCLPTFTEAFVEVFINA